MSRLLTVKNLKTYFYTQEGVVKAVDGLNFFLSPGGTLGIVGESGSGKSVTALSIMRLIPLPGRIIGGEVIFDGQQVLQKSEKEMRAIRGNLISMVFQDPMTSLNPVLTIGEQVAETIMLHQKLPRKEAREKAIETLELVKIPHARERIKDYPHQFSGGMRQRVMIAIALACHPRLLIADEPTTALDVTIQAQIIDLMKNLKGQLNMAIILITHNLGLVAELCEKVLVMYAGDLMESTAIATIFQEPKHPYTWGLLQSLPRLDRPRSERLEQIEGQPPSLINLPPGCPFHPRCQYVKEECRQEKPSVKEVSPGHLVGCWLYQ